MPRTTIYEDLASQFIDADKALAKGLGLPVKPRRQATPFLDYHLKKRKDEEPPPQPPPPAVTTPALGARGQPAANLTPEELALAQLLGQPRLKSYEETFGRPPRQAPIKVKNPVTGLWEVPPPFRISRQLAPEIAGFRQGEEPSFVTEFTRKQEPLPAREPTAAELEQMKLRGQIGTVVGNLPWALFGRMAYAQDKAMTEAAKRPAFDPRFMTFAQAEELRRWKAEPAGKRAQARLKEYTPQIIDVFSPLGQEYEELPLVKKMTYELPIWALMSATSATKLRASLVPIIKQGGKKGLAAELLSGSLAPVAGVEEATGIVVKGTLKYGLYLPAKAVITPTLKVSRLNIRAFENALDNTIDQWIGQSFERSKWVATQSRLTERDWQYRLLRSFMSNKSEIEKKATEYFLRFQAEAKAGRMSAQAARAEAVKATVKDVETLLLPKGTQTGAMAFGGLRAPTPESIAFKIAKGQGNTLTDVEEQFRRNNLKAVNDALNQLKATSTSPVAPTVPEKVAPVTPKVTTLWQSEGRTPQDTVSMRQLTDGRFQITPSYNEQTKGIERQFFTTKEEALAELSKRGEVKEYTRPAPEVGIAPVKVAPVKAAKVAPVKGVTKLFPKYVDNYRKPLSVYTDVLYHETDVEGLFGLMPQSTGYWQGDIYFANTPDLALGQGTSKGVHITFSAEGIEGQLNKKPVWEMLYKQNQAEFIDKHPQEAVLKKNIQEITIDKSAKGSQGQKLAVQNWLKSWDKTINLDGSITYRPEVQAVAPAKEVTKESFDATVDGIYSDIEIATKDLSPSAQLERLARIDKFATDIENASKGIKAKFKDDWYVSQTVDRISQTIKEIRGVTNPSEKVILFSELKQDLHSALADHPVMNDFYSKKLGIDVRNLFQTVSKAVALPKAEAVMPEAVGRETVAYGPDPTKAYQMRYRLVELEDLITSHTDAFAPNPVYPKELQPRIRERGAGRLAVTKMAKDLVPEALIQDSNALDRGPMIVGADNVVESGNGRVMALRLAQQSYPERWQAYQKTLQEASSQFGFNPAQVARMRNPVLVRERISDVDRVKFTSEANQPAVAVFSPLENALQDARRIRFDDLVLPEADQSIDTTLRMAGNRQFVSSFLETLPANEQASLLDAGGELNLVGMQRIKAAMFARTYPGEAGKELTRIFFESREPIIKNIEDGMLASLPKVAKAEDFVRSGNRASELTIAEDLAKSLKMLAVLRQRLSSVDPKIRAKFKKGGSVVEQYLSQRQIFERELTPFQEKLLTHIEDIARSPRKVREFLSDYADAVVASASPQQTTMMGVTRLTKEDIFNATVRRQQEGDLFATAEAPTIATIPSTTTVEPRLVAEAPGIPQARPPIEAREIIPEPPVAVRAVSRAEPPVGEAPQPAVTAKPQAQIEPAGEGVVPPVRRPPTARRPSATITGESATQRVKAIQASDPNSVAPADAKEAHIEMAAPDGPRIPKPPGAKLSAKDEPSDIVRALADKTTKGERPDQALLRLHEAAIGNENRRVNILIREGNQKLKALGIGVVRRGNLVPKTEDIPQLDALYNALHNPSKVASGEIAIPKGYEKIYQELRGLTDWEQAARLDFDPAMATVDDYFYRGWKPPEGAFADVQQGRPLVRTPAFKKPRVDATYQEMREAGFEPLFWNPYQQWGISRMQGTKYREQMELVSSLKGMGDELIRPHTGGAIPQGWRVPEVGSAFEGKPFSTTDTVTGEPTVMFTRRWIVPDKVANTLENIYGKKPNLGKFILAGKTIDPMAIIDWITFIPKRAKLFGTFFQQIDFLTRSGAGSWTRMVDAVAEGKPVKGLTALAKYPQSVGTILRANFSPTYRQTLVKQLDSTVPLIKDRPGINLKGISEAGLSTIDVTIFPADMDKLVRQVATEAGVLGKGKRLAGAVGDLESAMRRGLFEGVYRAAIITDIKNNIAPMLARQYPDLTDAQLNGMIARVTNIKYSTIPASQSVIQNRVLRETLRRVFFSTGELEGLLRQATGAFHGPYASFWRKHWLGVYLFLIATANVIHFASTGKPLPKERYVPISKNEWGPLPIGYNTQFASPTLPFKGRGEAELTLDIVGQMDTAFRVLDPAFFIQARQGVPVRALINQVSGTDFFGERIDDVGPGGVVSRTNQLITDLFSPIGGGGLATELARRRIPGAKEITTRGEERIGLTGLAIQATGMNVQAAPKIEALDRAMTKLGLAGATEANLKQRQARYKAYFDIPSDVDEVKANRKEFPYTRAEYRERHPEVDAKLFILGYVSSLSDAARNIAVKLMRENKLTVDDIAGLKLGAYPSQTQKDRRSWFERALGITPAPTTPAPVALTSTSSQAQKETREYFEKLWGNTPQQQLLGQNIPSAPTTPLSANSTNLEKWEAVKARGDSPALKAFNKIWYSGELLTTAEEDLLKAIFQQFPFGQTNYKEWKKQTMRQIYGNSLFGK